MMERELVGAPRGVIRECRNVMRRSWLRVWVATAIASLPACDLVEGHSRQTDASVLDAGLSGAGASNSGRSNAPSSDTSTSAGDGSFQGGVSVATGTTTNSTGDDEPTSRRDESRETDDSSEPMTNGSSSVAVRAESTSDAPATESANAGTPVSTDASSGGTTDLASTGPGCTEPEDVVADAGACECLTVSGPDGEKYAFCVDRVTHADARERCQQAGGHLASIHSLAEHDWLLSVSALLQLGEWWIGLTDSNEEGAFVWDDGTPVDFERWKMNEPNDLGGGEGCDQCGEDCGQLAWESWNDLRCSSTIGYICKF